VRLLSALNLILSYCKEESCCFSKQVEDRDFPYAHLQAAQPIFSADQTHLLPLSFYPALGSSFGTCSRCI